MSGARIRCGAAKNASAPQPASAASAGADKRHDAAAAQPRRAAVDDDAAVLGAEGGDGLGKATVACGGVSLRERRGGGVVHGVFLQFGPAAHGAGL